MKSRKGFTLVELLVVIAILAILATASIIGFTAFTRRAEVSNDSELVAQLNKYAQAATVSKDFKTVTEMRDELVESGFELANLKLDAEKQGYAIGFDIVKDRFVLLKGIEAAEGYTIEKPTDVFVFVRNAQEADLYGGNGFSLYLQNEFSETSLSVKTGLDVGEVSGITSISYSNNSGAQDVVIRTNGGSLTVKAPLDTVKHYGNADKVDVQAVANASYHENGTVQLIAVKEGHVKLEGEADVNGVYVYTDNASAGFEDIKITVDSGVEVPKLSRSAVEIADEGTKVCTIVTDQAKDVYLFNEGIYEQIKTVDAGKNVASDASATWADNSAKNTENTQTAAMQLANEFNGSYDGNGKIADQVVEVTGDNAGTYTVKFNQDTREFETYQGDTIVTEAAVVEAVAEVADVASEAGKTVEEAKASSALKGSGTQADPFLIYDYETMQKISDFYALGYYYFEVAIEKTNNGVIDCSNWKSVKLCGSFDGKGVIFNKPSDALFECVVGINQDDAYVKNFTINSVYEVRTGYYCAPVVDWTEELNIFTIENVKVSGYAEATIISSFVGWSEAKTTLIKNSESSLTLVSTGSQVSGFVGNSLGVNNVTVIDSIFSGSEVSTADSGQYLYAHNNSNCTLTLSYTNSFKDSHSNLYPEFSNKATQANSYSVYSKITKQSLTLPEEIGTPITVDKDPTAVKAVATYVIGVNPGCFTRVYQRDEIDLTGVSESTFNTTTVMKYNIVINDGIHKNEAVGNTQYIKDSACDGTYECVVFTVVQYDATGSITSIRTISLPGNH